MAQIFNNQPQQPPTQPPHSPPPNMQQGQIYRRKSRIRFHARIFAVIAGILVIIGLPLTLILSNQQQQYQQSAHTPQPSVTAVCQNGTVILTSKYYITNVPSGVTCQVTATDSENYLNDTFSTSNNQTHTKTANTQKSTIPPGVVTFKTTCKDGFTGTNQAGYKISQPCITPTPTPTKKLTPTPTITPTPTAKPTPTPTVPPGITPTACITPGQVQNVKVTCANCSSTQ